VASGASSRAAANATRVCRVVPFIGDFSLHYVEKHGLLAACQLTAPILMAPIPVSQWFLFRHPAVLRIYVARRYVLSLTVPCHNRPRQFILEENRHARWKVAIRFVNMQRLLAIGSHPSGAYTGST
jgi:hypothetical protein